MLLAGQEGAELESQQRRNQIAGEHVGSGKAAIPAGLAVGNKGSSGLVIFLSFSTC